MKNTLRARIWQRLTRPYRTKQKRRLEAVLAAHGIGRKQAGAIANQFFSTNR
ncbi:hypothetical protein [Polaromonas sp. C04]|uniref:hypothetical protein n=1 Tax=Polaromonas sp. C04 TaxID=1945857 RepID=UPI00143B5747|nr:hypothetical protein [Polaromonas sp. C04]